MKRKLSLIIVAGMILFQSFSAYPLATFAAETNPLKATLQAGSTYASAFPDANLAKVVAQAATGSDDITQVATQADLDKVVTLTANSKEIANLTGIDLLRNVTSINLSDNKITTVSLKGDITLPNLTSINLRGNDLTTIDIQDQPKLVKVFCDTQDNAEISEVILKNLPALKVAGGVADGSTDTIDFSKTRSLTKGTIENLPEMAGSISFTECSITEIIVKNLPQAQNISVYDNKLTTLSGLENLPLITRIYASKNEITELESLKSFPTMGVLAVNNNHISALPESIKTNNPTLTVINATNQTVTLSEKAAANKLVLNNEIKNFGVVATAKAISNKGTYKDNQITWTAENLEDINTVEYAFDESVSESSIQGTFSGKVTVPFKKVDLPVITAREEIYYAKNANISEQVFLSNVAASATEGATITSDYNTVVDFTKGGTYEVTLNAKNSAGFEAEPVKVKVHINKALAPVITANTEISYMVFAEVTEADFLKNIQASTNDGSVITSDFGTVVKLNEAGDYTVTLKSVNSDDVDAKPVQVTVRITPKPTPILANVVFNIDDVQTTEAIVVEGFITEPAAPTKEGYTFDGWFDAKTGGNKWNFATNKMPAAGLTLYAQFSKTVNDDPQTGGGTTVTENNNGDLSDPPANTNNKAKDQNKKSQTGKHPATGDSQNMLYLLAGLLLVGVSLRIFKKSYSK
ncbi:LapB repeat-containing protein [Listeria monocytogenes]|uniref:LapB repeat-containing protein n=1 Tax=Listeria monocytogenes TaxID=1639 RepID=UPI00085BC374|nr:LapB repeat-containing protein [Listeria monocytogenes]EAG9490201.1 LPXTG cell wall anchor domain-containing protein [Listeria monocytogenes]OET93225.1 cell wall anchor protein [Listeria monocytogenes]WIH38759.1 LapB repeat-containing protein [Listeria monocytogenes]